MIKVVLYGAYDRYNFGDNLMPIVFELYVKKYHPELMIEMEFVYSSISDSDLSRYACLETKSINSVSEDLSSGDCVVVVGGEVLCASTFTLFTHMPKPKVINDLLKFINRVPYINRIVHKLTHALYHAPWSYPYIPNKAQLNKDVKVIYNTVGGGLTGLPQKDYGTIFKRLNDADFISVRDKRTENELRVLERGAVLAPDSVYIISSLCDDAFIQEHITNKVEEKFDFDYVVFQAAPTKVGEKLDDVVNSLRKISKESNCKIVLLPIGYAAGHDDYHYLQRVYKQLSTECELVYDLNIWEILYLIKNSKAYIGTSLHGAIIAMSYAVPHFGLNKNIKKLDAFLNDWSITPFNECRSIKEIAGIVPSIDENVISGLEQKRFENAELVRKNFDALLKVIISG